MDWVANHHGISAFITGWVLARQSEKRAERQSKAQHLAEYKETTVTVLTRLRLIVDKLKPSTFSQQSNVPQYRQKIMKTINEFERQEEPLMRVTVGQPTATSTGKSPDENLKNR